MQLQQTMSHDVHEWERRGKPKDRLYRGSQLKEALVWQGRNAASGSESAFLRASTARRTSLLFIAFLLLALLFPTELLLQQRFLPLTVTTLKDDAPGSLREAIGNALPGGTIIIDSHLKGTITLNKTLVIGKDLTIRGPGVNQLTLRGKRDQGYLIHVPHHVTVTLSQVTFSDPTPAIGPVIKNEGILTLDTCQIIGNTETSIGGEGTGGIAVGIENEGGVLTLQKSIIPRNTLTAPPGGFGGGIGSYGGAVTISNSQIVENAVVSDGANIAGGGITATETRITVINSVVARNRVVGGQKTTGGGGISSIKSIITLTNSMVTDNRVETHGRLASGGGILSGNSNITLNNSRISGNVVVNHNQDAKATASGGAIASSGDQITIQQSQLHNNSVTAQGYVFGGAVATVENTNMSIAGTTMAHNLLTSAQDAAAGGGIYNGATLSITDSVISENSISGATANAAVAGGGIETQGPMLTFNNSTLALNTVSNSKGTAAGGGIFAYQFPGDNVMVELTNCTITGNQVQADLHGGGKGGGFGMNGPASQIHFCTVTGNVASSQGGGLYVAQIKTSEVHELSLKNSIVAGNTATAGPDISGPLLTGGYNLVQHWTSVLLNDALKMHQTDLSVKPPAQVGIMTHLHMNGGATPTLALQAGSPAIDTIPASGCDVTTDQRGVKRPQHAACDIGAYEYS
ncbi:MAG: hypothetical protein J2P37_05005 [Ktedonobacteraceae bacterium]|nr:hypothetical protein [Ktedonobacteraceae bacterium]